MRENRYKVESAKSSHRMELADLFKKTIEDTCRRNRIFDQTIVETEIQGKIAQLNKYNDFGPNHEYLNCILFNDKPIAVGGYFHCGDDVMANYADATSDDFEIGSVYVDPDFQRAGLGRMIFEDLKNRLKGQGIAHAFIDSGYPSSQLYWRSLLGDPIRDVPSSFGPAFRYQVWKVCL